MNSESHNPSPSPEAARPRAAKITVPRVTTAPERGERLVMVTAYDYRQARLADEAGVDLVLVGDSLAMVVLGYEDTLSVTVDEMLHHVKAVRRGLTRPLLVADMPYGSFHLGARHAVGEALRFVKEGGAHAVKIEGPRPEVVEALVGAEIPAMGHLGLTPQSVHALGGYRVQGRTLEARQVLLDAARRLEDAGAFSLVLECVPSDLAAEVSERLAIPTIGIGAGPACDGQVLVFHDLLGFEDRLAPRFVRRYEELGRRGIDALMRYAADVRSGSFPNAEESYGATRETPARLERLYG
jgi:3-methyl-2-oxobutanoate hydroxymethyltransferase